MSNCLKQDVVLQQESTVCDHTDLVRPTRLCEIGETVTIVHLLELEISVYDEILRIGGECSEKLLTEYVLLRKALLESLIRRSRFRAEWLKEKWRDRASFQESFLRDNDHPALVFAYEGRFNYMLGGNYGPGGFKTSEEAKLAVFDVLFPLPVWRPNGPAVA